MAKEYKVGERYYLPVTVKSICPGYKYPIELMFIDSNYGDTDDEISVADEPDLLLTSDEIATDINTERAEVMETLGKQNLELSKQNEELGTKVDDLEAELNNAKAAIDRWREIENHNTSYIDKQTRASNRKDKEIEILIDRITKLEAELAEERERKNG